MEKSLLKFLLPALVVIGLSTQTAVVRAETPDATGVINCKLSKAQPYFPCPFTVFRTGHGAAKVNITFPDGTIRTITYKDGKVASTDGAATFTVEKIEDLATIHIGNESYEIVDAVPFGG